MTTGKKIYPYPSYRFIVQVENETVGGFSEVSGLEAEVEIEEYQEGGNLDYTIKLIKGKKYPNLVLKRGLTDSDYLWKWYKEITEGNIKPKSGAVLLLDAQGKTKLRWNFSSAFPIKWTGPDLKATGNEISIESIELVHRGINKAETT